MNNEYDGRWIDSWGTCKACGGELPHGHSTNCDIYKLQMKEETLGDILSIASCLKTPQLPTLREYLEFQYPAMAGDLMLRNLILAIERAEK